MRDSEIRGRRGARAAVLVAGLGTALALGEPARAGAGYSWDGQAVVVRWHEVPAEIGDPEAAVSLTVYGDGRVALVRGRARRDAGQYTLRLTRPELDALVQALVDGGLPSFDANAVTRSKQAADTRRAAEARAGGPATLRVASDVGTTTIEVRLDQGQRTVVWHGMREDARDHPDIAALQGLGAADAALRALAGHPRLQRAD